MPRTSISSPSMSPISSNRCKRLSGADKDWMQARWPTESWSREGMGGSSGQAAGLPGSGDGADENAHALFATQTEAAAADVEQARRSGLNDLQAATAADAEFRHSADPGRFAANLSYVGPFAW